MPILEDAIEELVFELEDMFDLQRIAWVQFSPDPACAIYTDDFTGDTFFDGAPWEADVALPHVATFKRGAATPSSKADLPARARAWLAGIDFFDAVTYKFEKAEYGKTRDEATGVAKATIAARRNGLAAEIFERSEAVFRKVRGQWRVASLKRLSGTKKEAKQPIFVDATAAIGADPGPEIDCHSCLHGTPFDVCGGLAAIDYDDDGDHDLFVTRIGAPVLLRNDGGRFTDVTEKAGLSRKGAYAGALALDADNDGRLDLLTTSVCPADHACKGCAVMLWRNKGDGTFEDVTERAFGLRHGQARSACAADVDGDGDLDVFVAMYGTPEKVGSLTTPVHTRSYVNARDGMPDLLFINRGDGTFEERGKEAGVADTGWGLACLFFDHGGDGRPDLYLVNDFGEHVFYRNRGGGRFEEATAAAFGGRDVGFGMGVCMDDYDLDGDTDLYVSNMYSSAGNRVLARSPEVAEPLRKRLLKMAQGNSLMRNDGASFVETAVAAGCANAGWAWGSVFLDYDEDGWPDLYVANGYTSGRNRKDL